MWLHRLYPELILGEILEVDPLVAGLVGSDFLVITLEVLEGGHRSLSV